MSSSTSHAPLRIAIFGLDRMGAYHLERLSLRDDVRVMGVCDPHGASGTLGPQHLAREYESCESLLHDPDIEAVLVSSVPGLRDSLAIAALEAGKHVAIGLPLASTLESADRLLATSRRTGRVLAVVPYRRWDDDFRTALAELRSGKLGRLRAAKRLLWDYRIEGGSGPQHADALDRVGPDLLHQMLHLFDDPPCEVFARLPSDCRDAFTLSFRFPSGATALIDVDMAAIAPLRTGWALLGNDGAWRGFRRFTKTPDEEIYETPIEPLPTLWDEAYPELIRTIRETEPGRIPADTLQARRVVDLMSAARESAATGCSVPLRP